MGNGVSSALRAGENRDHFQGLKPLATIIRPTGEDSSVAVESVSLFHGPIQIL